ncbi:unnamed protein product [Penicillium salamii]|nr:unnamed protein product [Penicillium salamii]CAG8326507.1 unnamed protein product [Penicillium salamii]
MDMHLVWTSSHMFIKAIPRFLLVPRFLTDHLSCLPCCICTCPHRRGSSVEDTLVDESACDCWRLWRSALRFLFSYAALISHKSDFTIAQEKKLIPTKVA